MRKPRVPISVSGVLVAAFFATLGVGASASQATVQGTPRVLVSGGSPPYVQFRHEPHLIVYSGDGAALLAGRRGTRRHLRWTIWNSKKGWASGADWHNNCTPDCAQGTYLAYPAKIKVYRPQYVDRYLIFTRMTVFYTGKRPPYPAYHHRSVTYKVRYNAQHNEFFWILTGD